MTTVRPPTLDIALPRTTTAASTARQQVRGTFGALLVPDRLADAELAVTELVANAVVHGTGDILLRMRVEAGRLFGEVIDEGGGFEHVIRRRTASDVTGRGLGIVAALADEWGIHEGSTHVWFALDGSEGVSGTTDPQLGDDRRPHGPGLTLLPSLSAGRHGVDAAASMG